MNPTKEALELAQDIMERCEGVSLASIEYEIACALDKQTQLIGALREECEAADARFDGYVSGVGPYDAARAARLKLEDEMKL